MISFSDIEGWSIDRLSALLAVTEGGELEYLGEVFLSFSELSENSDAEIALAVSSGCVAVRIYDGGRYLFPLPVEINGESDIRRACREIAEYSRRELIPLYFSDVPREYLSVLGELFLHIDARAYDSDEDLFGVMVRNECQLYDGVPFLDYKGITLDGLRDGDRENYARLCSDRDLNRWWGYDVSADNPTGDPDFYLKVARGELDTGMAMALAVRRGGEFIGEAVIYDFDYMGSASVGVRILPEHQGRGLGTLTFGAVLTLCRDLGLMRVTASVMEENIPSLRVTDKYMQRTHSEDGRIYYELNF